MQDGFSSNFNTPQKLNDVLDFILTKSMERFDFQMGVIVRFRKQQSQISHSINYGFSNQLLPAIEALNVADIMQLNTEPTADFFLHKFPIKLNTRLGELQQILAENSLNQGLTVLFKIKGRVWGALHLWHTREIVLTEEDCLEFSAFNEMLEMAIENGADNATRFFPGKVHEKELLALNSIISKIDRATDLNGALSRALKETLDVLELEAGGIYLIDKSKGEAQLVSSKAPACEKLRQLEYLKLRNPSVATVLQADKSLVTLELAFQSQLTQPDKIDQTGSRIVTIPLRTQRATMGFINLTLPFWRTFTSDEIYLLDSISKQIGVAVENKLLNKKMEKISVKKSQVAA